VSLYYIDTSAALKLLAEESHSQAFAKFYDENADASWVSSALLRIEVIRAVGRVMPAALPDARALLLAFSYFDLKK
jgi:predicted nucleic acid-binding protein